MMPLLRATGLVLVAAVVGAAAAWMVSREGEPRRTLLLTGFGPFGTYAVNPAWEIARSLDGVEIGRTRVVAAKLDVTYAAAADQLRAAIERFAPDRVLCLGVAPEERLRLEVVARNRDRSAAPDNDGVAHEGAPIRAGGPDLLPTRLPVAALLERLGTEGYGVRTSEDAGGYLCNHVFYRLMDEFPDRAIGLVHVPPLEGPWDLERLQAAVRTIVEVLDAAP